MKASSERHFAARARRTDCRRAPRLAVWSGTGLLASASREFVAAVADDGHDSRVTTAYEEEVARFRARREARLVAPDGWFALVERIWLGEGDNALPFGTVAVSGDRLRLVVAPDKRVTVGGQPVQQADLTAGDGGDVLGFEGRRFDATRVGGRLCMRVRDSSAAERAGFRGVPCYPVDPRWCAPARLEPYATPRELEIPFTSDETHVMQCPGVLVLTVAGSAVRLEPLLQPGDTRLFLLFSDATNRTETYGGGRFLYAPLPDEAGHTVVDFNKACNPACVFNPIVICPLPPDGNRLPFPIEAGEKRWPAV